MVSGSRRLTLDTLAALLAVGGVILVVVGGRPPADQWRGTADAAARLGPPGPPAGAATRPAAGGAVGRAAAVSASAGPAPLGPSVPVRLDIPAIGLSTPLMALGRNADGTIAVPPLRHDAPAGWYRYLATPGEVGPAVILGHVDTARDGPAVFYRLRDLRSGDTVTVRRLDGSTAVFTVTRTAQYSKLAFPTEAVYGAVDRPALRLITCGGTFDPINRQYRSNIVVYATLTASTPG
ncbi:class F sortase [Planosporangium thailandense]|uniref:Class F sortase n=1 Tax=Planosporangium thailandense TaxID=765197 RepID=A0ABX0XXX0_9ACTN|nr:class F sortase [Planosporangium thailandense]NJC70691.1 class F sortase [Planosporangium thailandense]